MIGATVRGIPELKAALASIVPKLRRRVLRNALAAGARIVQKRARAAAPVLKLAQQTRRRKSGTLKKAISVRTSKIARQRGDVGVFVSVEPNREGTNSPDDPYYWPWVNWGHRIVGRYKGRYTDYRIRGRGRLHGLTKRRRASTKRVPGRFFMERGVDALPLALDVFLRVIGPQIAKLNRKGQSL